MNKKRLPLDEWEHLIPDVPSRIRANHASTDCSGGRDCMIVEKKEDGTSNAYCFRCDRSGYHSPIRYFKSSSSLIERPSARDDLASRSPPADAHGSVEGFGREAREWLLRGGVTASIAKARGIVWSDSTERIYLPVAKAGDNVGWVVRGFNPKYYRASGKDIFGYYISDNVINNGKIVIVEDLLSAWKCSQVVDSIALLGTNIKPQVVKEILERNYKDAYIFLDGDNPQVRMKARKIAKRLLTLNTTVLETGNDPKYLDVTTIEGMIK